VNGVFLGEGVGVGRGVEGTGEKSKSSQNSSLSLLAGLEGLGPVEPKGLAAPGWELHDPENPELCRCEVECARRPSRRVVIRGGFVTERMHRAQT